MTACSLNFVSIMNCPVLTVLDYIGKVPFSNTLKCYIFENCVFLMIVTIKFSLLSLSCLKLHCFGSFVPTTELERDLLCRSPPNSQRQGWPALSSVFTWAGRVYSSLWLMYVPADVIFSATIWYIYWQSFEVCMYVHCS